MRRLHFLLIAVAALCVGLVLRATTPLQIATGTWAEAGEMTGVRAGAAAVLLADGRILITGGTDAAGNPVNTTEFFNADGTFSAGPPMATARAGHAALWLFNGEVIVTGGTTDAQGSVTNTAEIFDPMSGSGWITLPSVMLEARSGHTMTPLQDGSALIAGGVDNSGTPVSALEVLRIAPTEAFVAAGALHTGRKNHGAAGLLDGRVLIIGGTNASGSTLASSEIYDPASGLTSTVPELGTPRSAMTATTLLDGKVLIAGGSFPEAVTVTNADGTTSQTGPAELASMEVYDPVAGTITASTTAMGTGRSGHQAFLLPNNNAVLFVGGTYNGLELASADLYTPWTGEMVQTPSLSAARYHSAGSALSSATYPVDGTDGLLIIAGGKNQQSAELYGFATVRTDKSDYSPGEIVTITGSGWQPDELVTLNLRESPSIDTPGPYIVKADAAGNIFDQEFVPDVNDLNVRFYLTAVGLDSQAQNTFTDAPKNYKATMSPTTSSAGTASTYSVTIANCTDGLCGSGNGTGTQQIGSAQITVPASFTSVTLVNSTVTASNGKTWNTSISAGVISMFPVNAGQGKLSAGESVTVGVNATAACTAGNYAWQTIAGSNTTAPAGNDFSLIGSQPSVTVSGSCDSVAPTTTIALTPATPNGTNSWYTSNVHVTVSAADNTGGSGVAETRCVLDPPTPPATFDAIPAGCAYTASGADVTTEGQHVIYAASKDNIGNKEAPTNKSFKIDKTAPDTQITSQPASLTNSTSANLSFTGTDNLTAAASLTFECSLDSNLNSAFTACTSPKNFPTLTAGPHTFYVRAIDQAGNTDPSPAAFTWTIDNVAPTVTVQFTPPVHGINGWYNKDDTVSGTVTATDDSNISSLTCLDGASSITLTPSGIGTKTATASVALMTDGTHNISCTAVDAATNSGSGSASVKIDTTIPALELHFTPDSPDGSNGWWKTPSGVPFVWTCGDTGSGIDGSFNGGCPSTLTGTITTQGATTYTLQVRDQAGNLSANVNRTLQLDNTAPTISATLDKAVATTGWFNISTGAPTVNFTCSDATPGSGLAANACPVNHLFGEGADQSFSGTVTDIAGNTASAQVEHVNVDITAPSLSLQFTPNTPDGENGWWKAAGGVPFAWTCTDTGSSGVDTAFNGGCPTPLSGTITAQGSTTLTLQVRDVAGNLSSNVDRTIKLDNVAPTITAQLDKTADAPTGWFNISTGAPTASFTCSDATAGIAVGDCPGTHLFGNGADQSFSGTVKDQAGNTASAAVEHINVDLIAPTLTVAFTPDTPDGSNGWWKTPGGVPYIWTCTDAGSGIDTGFNGGCPATLTGTVTAQGSSSFNRQVRDIAGNPSATVNRTLMLDNVAPTITAQVDKTADATTGWFNIGTGAPTASFTCSDATSGLAAGACPGSHLFGEGADQSFSGSVSDEAGNSASAKVEHVSVDVSAPTLTLVFSPDSPDGNNGWWKTPGGVPYTWTCLDATSGIDTAFAACPTSGLDTTQGTTNLSAQIKDKAGNASVSVTRTINLDNVAPTVSLYPAADLCSVPGTNGWCRGTQTAGFSAADATSGLIAASPFTQSTAANGGAMYIPSGSVCDAAGNCSAGINAGPYKLDSVAPTLTCGPAPIYTLSQPGATVSATLVDTLSGPLAPGTTITGPADTSTAAPNLTASITGHDEAGNTTSQSCSYNVGYKLIAFLQPWAPPGALAFKRGSTIPLKWQYANYFGTPVDTRAMSPPPAVGIAGGCGSVPTSSDVIAVESPGVSGLTYDTSTFTWHYNWQTKGVNVSCYWLGVQTDSTKQLDLYGWSSTLGTLPLQVQLR